MHSHEHAYLNMILLWWLFGKHILDTFNAILWCPHAICMLAALEGYDARWMLGSVSWHVCNAMLDVC